MKKIFVSLIAMLLVVCCVASLSACSIDEIVEGVDFVLGASVGTQAEGESGLLDAEFTGTGIFEELGVSVPVIDVPDENAPTYGLHFTVNKDKTAYTVTGYSKMYTDRLNDLEQNVYIPYSYNGLPVVDIAPRAFENTNINSVTLPKTLLRVGKTAFQGSTVSIINIPASLIDIAPDAFIGCNNLSFVTVDEANPVYSLVSGCLVSGNVLIRGFGNCEIPESITEIADNAFKGCNALTEITVPATVTKIGRSAFAGCPNLVSANIECAIDALPENTFDGATSLNTVILPEGIKEIGYAAFRATGLTSYTVPATVEKIGSYAFANCKSLVNLELSAALLSISGGLLQNSNAISSIYIPEGVTTIGGYAFSGCASLVDVYIPSTCTTISDGAFYNCTRLTSLFIPKAVTRIGIYVVYGVSEGFTFLCEGGARRADWEENWNTRYIYGSLASKLVVMEYYYVTVQYNQTRPEA